MTRGTKAEPAQAWAFVGRPAQVIRRTVTAVVFVIAGLTFTFGFGSGLALGLLLGVPGWIAPLVAPAVDLTVIALLTSLQYLRAQGMTGRLVGPRLLLGFSGLATLAINTAHPLLVGSFGQAAFYAVPPLLLLGWSEVGPRLLAALHGTGPEPSRPVPDERAGVSPELLTRARRVDKGHRREHGRPVTRDRLRAELKVSNAVAGAVLRRLRGESADRSAQPSRR